MTTSLVIDANIIIRSVLGKKVRDQLLTFNDMVDFFTPDICVEEVEKHLPIIFRKRGISPQLPMEVFSCIQNLLQVINFDLYREREHEAKKRIKSRDMNDWPIVATSLLFNCPIWTEDKDFFGVGIPVWTTDRIHLYFDSLKEKDLAL